jgi:hypothetical protein
MGEILSNMVTLLFFPRSDFFLNGSGCWSFFRTEWNASDGDGASQKLFTSCRDRYLGRINLLPTVVRSGTG